MNIKMTINPVIISLNEIQLDSPVRFLRLFISSDCF